MAAAAAVLTTLAVIFRHTEGDEEAERFVAILGERTTEDQEEDEEKLFSASGREEFGVLTTKPAIARMMRCAKILSRDVRLKLGCFLSPTEANRMVCHELLVKAAVARNVRIVDRLELVQLALPMCFLPDKMDFHVKRVIESREVSDLRSEYAKQPRRRLWEVLLRRRRNPLRWHKT